MEESSGFDAGCVSDFYNIIILNSGEAVQLRFLNIFANHTPSALCDWLMDCSLGILVALFQIYRTAIWPLIRSKSDENRYRSR